MSHLAIAFIIVVSISIIILLLIIMHNKHIKARNNSMLSFFKVAGTAHNLSFTGQEILRDKIIGLDGPKRKLLVVEEDAEEYSTQIIYLDEVAACKVKKVYAAINSHEYRKNRPEEYLKSIALEFEFNRDEAPVTVVFYKNSINSIYEIPELEARAKHWATTLSKMSPKPSIKNPIS
ncbi:MAG TPA: hypothetical protein VHD83_15360 [Puia sp.]|nr:hypothetical protein [Puia sp.]